MWSGVSELCTSLWSVLSSLDVSDVVSKIVVDIRVSSAVEADSLVFRSGVDTITGVGRVENVSGDLSLAVLDVEVLSLDLSSSLFGDWDGEGVLFVSDSLSGDINEVDGWDLSLLSSGDFLSEGEFLSGGLDSLDFVNDGLLNEFNTVGDDLVVDGLLDLLNLNLSDFFKDLSLDLLDDDLANSVEDDLLDLFDDLSWDLLCDDRLNVLEDDFVNGLSDSSGDLIDHSFPDFLSDGLSLKGGDLSLDGIEDSSGLLSDHSLWNKVDSGDWDSNSGSSNYGGAKTNS